MHEIQWQQPTADKGTLLLSLPVACRTTCQLSAVSLACSWRSPVTCRVTGRTTCRVPNNQLISKEPTMDTSEFRTELHRYIDNHGETYSSMWTGATKTVGGPLVERRIILDPEGLSAGCFIHGDDGVDKLIWSLDSFAGITIATLVNIPAATGSGQ